MIVGVLDGRSDNQARALAQGEMDIVEVVIVETDEEHLSRALDLIATALVRDRRLGVVDRVGNASVYPDVREPDQEQRS